MIGGRRGHIRGFVFVLKHDVFIAERCFQDWSWAREVCHVPDLVLG